MNKFILAAFLTLLAFQSIDGQFLFFDILWSIWSFTGFIISTTWSIFDLIFWAPPPTTLRISTATFLNCARQSPKLGLQVMQTSSSMTTLTRSLTIMRTQSQFSSMTTTESMISEQTITLAEQSGFSLLYLLSSTQTATIGVNITANISAVLGFNPNYTSPQNLSTVGLQAQAVIQLSANLSSEIANYCQQYFDLAQTVNATCPTCPTNETCQQVINKWQNASLSIQVSANSTLTNTTLIRSLNVTVQGTLLDAINSTNILIKNMTECARCLNTGCTGNQVVLVKPCSRKKGSGNSSERKEYCRQKGSGAMKRLRRMASRGRKNKSNKSKQRQRGKASKNRGHWRGVWNRASQMARNYYTNCTVLRIPSLFVRNQMFFFSFLFGNFTQLSGNLTETISQNATESINNATQTANILIETAVNTSYAEALNFTQQVMSDGYPNCTVYANVSAELFLAFQSNVSNCASVLQTLSNQTFTNISITFTTWIQTINIWSGCHDKCIRNYCGNIRSPSLCWLFKQFLPGTYDTQGMIDSYGSCCGGCSGQIQQASLTINSTANVTMESTSNATQVALEQVQQCIALNLTNFEVLLNQTIQAYNACVVASTPKPAVLPNCGDFIVFDPAQPNLPASDGFPPSDQPAKTAAGFDAYIGRTTVNCGSTNLFPASIVLNSSASSGAGFYVSCSDSEKFNASGEYLWNHWDLTWVQANQTSLYSIPNNLKINWTDGSEFFYARVQVNGVYYLGYARNETAGGPNSIMFYQNGTQVSTTNYEVLVCPPAVVETTSTTTTTTESTSTTSESTTSTTESTTSTTEPTTTTSTTELTTTTDSTTTTTESTTTTTQPTTTTTTETTTTTTTPTTTTTTPTTTTSTTTPTTTTTTAPPTTTTTTIATTTASPTCARFIKCNPKQSSDYTNGFIGVKLLGSPYYYVGYTNTSCFGGDPSPSRFTADGVPYKCPDNLFASFWRDDIYDAYYLENNANLIWVNTNSTAVFNVPNKVALPGPSGTFFIGRYKNSYLGKIFVGPTTKSAPLEYVDWLSLFQWQIYPTLTYQVLACKP